MDQLKTQQTAQIRFFDQLKAKLPQQLTLVNAVADLLEVSTDSAYRRIRGETDLSVNEALLLAGEFGLSIDQLAGGGANTIVFRHGGLEFEKMAFKAHLKTMLEQARMIHQAKERKVYWFSRELPEFHLFQIPELFQFKSFFWAKSILGKETGQFELGEVDPEFEEIANQLNRLYIQVPTIEILKEDTFSSFLKQVKYYYESDFFKRPKDAFTLLDKLMELGQHVKSQAELGYKYLFGNEPQGEVGNFQLYYNEIIQSENMVYAELDDMQLTFLEHNVINNVITADQRFCAYTRQTLDRIISKSILISTVSERERNKYFRKTFRAIDKTRDELENE